MATLQTLPEATTFLPPARGVGFTTIAARSFLYAVFKHSRLVVGIFLLVFLAAAVSGVLRPNTWRANSKVLVKLGEMVQLAPAEQPSRSLSPTLTPEIVKTEAEIVKSTEVIRQAIARVGVQPEPGTSIEELVANMQQALTVTPLPGSNVLQVSYLGRSPERASRMVNAITDMYLDHHGHLYRNEGMESFYRKQLKVLYAQMKTAQKRMREYLRHENIVDVDAEIGLLTKDVQSQEVNLRTFRDKMIGTEKKLQAVRDQFAQVPAQVAYSEEYVPNPTLQTFKNKLAEIEVERSALLQAYLPNDRHVSDKDQAITVIRQNMQREQDRVLSNQTMRMNELRSDMQRNVYAVEVLLTALRAREPGIKARLAVTKKRLRELRDKRFTVTNLKTDAEQRAYAYDLYRKRREEARIQEEMTNTSMVNVSVVEHATPPLEPENGLLMPLLIGLLGGLAVGAGMAVAVEYLNRTLRFEEEVEGYLELPVLAVIPDLATTATVARA
jgi:uncharacterized protein involved in exopolysaccharide biosynthesis